MLSQHAVPMHRSHEGVPRRTTAGSRSQCGIWHCPPQLRLAHVKSSLLLSVSCVLHPDSPLGPALMTQTWASRNCVGQRDCGSSWHWPTRSQHLCWRHSEQTGSMPPSTLSPLIVSSAMHVLSGKPKSPHDGDATM